MFPISVETMVRVNQIVICVCRHLEEAHIHDDYLRRVDLLVLERVWGVLEARRGLNTWGSTNESARIRVTVGCLIARAARG